MAIWIWVALPLFASGQYIQPRLDTRDALMVHDLWEVEIYSHQPAGDYYFLSWKLFDHNGVLLAEAKSQSFLLQAIHYDFNENAAANSPREINFVSNEFRKKCEQTGNMIPAGNYSIGYVLYRTVAGCNWTGTVAAQLNYPIQIGYYNEIELLWPFNGDTIHETCPLLKWLPLSYTGDVQDQEYYLVVCEVFPGQTKELALMYNPPLFYQQLKEVSLLYPLYAQKLEPAKTYTWQVKALQGPKVICHSEVWQFTIAGSFADDPATVEPGLFFTLHTDPQPSTWVTAEGDYLFFTVTTGKNVNQQIDYTVYDNNRANEAVLTGRKYAMTISYGKNLYSLPINKLQHDGHYTLHVKTADGVGYLHFVKK